MTDQEQLVEDVLDGFVPVGDVPESFADHVLEQIARRPSPKPPDSQLDAIEAKLDEILTLLRGTPE